MTHQDCQDRLLDLAYGELGSEETAEMQVHLAACEACRAELARLGGIRVAMRRLEPELPPEHGEHLLLTAAHHAVEGRQRRAWLPSWAWRWSLTVAALAVVGTVSFRILSVRDRPLSREIEGRPETFAARPQQTAPTVVEAPAPSTAAPVAESPPQSVGRALVPRRPAADKAAKEATTATEERQVRAEAEASRDRLAADSRRFAQPPPSSATAQGESTATSRLRALGAPAARPAPAPAAEEKRKKSEAPKPLADSAGALGGAAMDQGAQAPGSEPSAAAGAAMEQATSQLGYQHPAEPSPATPEVPPLTAKTWQRDRRVRAVQKLVQEIDEAQRQRRLIEASRPFQACGPEEDAERRLYTLEGRTVKYIRQKGYRDLALTIEQLYDSQGRLRYAFIHGGAVNGAIVDHRLWLDEKGRRLWEAQKWRRGRYPLPEVWPDQDLTPQAPGPAALECGAP